MPLKSDTIRVVLVNDYTSTGGGMYVDFDYRLHSREGDFRVFANTWDARTTPEDQTDVLFHILQALFTNRSGVEQVFVKTYRLEIKRSRAVTLSRLWTSSCRPYVPLTTRWTTSPRSAQRWGVT